MLGVVVMRALGGILLLAAAMKLYGSAVEPVGGFGIFSQPWVQMLIVEWEILLGIWLVWGVNSGLAWVAAIATFVTFGCVSAWQGWIGQTNCGCFGAIRVNPWLTFGIDVSALALLVGTYHRALAGMRVEKAASWLRSIGITSCLALAFVGVMAGVGTILFGSPNAAVAYLRGERLSIRPRVVDVGVGLLGESRAVVIDLTNNTDNEIHIIGGTSDCSCITTENLPVVIAPGQSRPISVELRFTGRPGLFTRKAMLYTNDRGFRRVHFQLTGRTVEPGPGQRAATKSEGNH